MIQPARSGDDPIRPLLRPGERILWRGQPDVRAYGLRGSWFLIPFSVAWCAFAIYWEASVLASGAGGLFFALWGVPFVMIGLYLVFGRFLVARAEARGTHYAITDQRVLIVGGGFRRRLIEMALEDVPPAQLEQGAMGIGTISFGTSPYPFRMPPGWPMAGMYGRQVAFDSIRDASEAHRTLQDARSDAKAAARDR